MIYLTLFLEFLKIGVVSFGGGYAMIPLIQETVLHHSWLTESELLNFIAIAESTPGPIAINMATFIGISEGGILGAIIAVLGVVIPSFVIILIISIFIKNLLSNTHIQSILRGIRPVIVALILGAATTLLLSTIFSFKVVGDKFSPDIFGVIIFAIVSTTTILFKHFKKKNLSPIFLILLSGVLGIIFYGLI